jgi:hypothetical protein
VNIPPEVTAKAAELNAELVLNNMRLEPYIGDDEWGDQVRVRLVCTLPEFTMSHLSPEYMVSWHLFHLIRATVVGMHNKGVEDGLRLAKDRMVENITNLILPQRRRP